MTDQPFRIERKRLADQIADQLMAMIANGTFKPGDRLPSEPELMRRFNVGRSSIREAVGALSLIGLVTVRPGQGTHVAFFREDPDNKPIGLIGIGQEKMRELVEARIELEGVIARLAAERATDEDLEEIRQQHERLRQALTRKEDPISLDLAFHQAVAKASHNSVLIRFLAEMRQPIRNWMKQKARHNWGYERVHEQHAVIIAAIAGRDGLRAEEALKAHLRSTGERLVAALLSAD